MSSPTAPAARVASSDSAAAVPPSAWRRWAMGGAALIPLALAVGAHRAAATPAPMAAAGVRQPLVFEQYQVNLGPVPAVREVGARFSFTNRGERPLRIRELQPSCGCLNPQLEKREYAPGESGKFLLRVATAQQDSGPKEFTVKLVYDEVDAAGSASTAASHPASVDLAFKAVFPEKQVLVRPKALIFYQLGTQATTQDVMVIDQRAVPLEATAAVSSSDAVSVTLGPAEADIDGHRAYRLRITAAAKAPPGRTRAVVTVSTRDPAYPRIQVPVIVQGPNAGNDFASAHGAEPEVSPKRLAFQVAPGRPVPVETIELTTGPGERVNVIGAESATGNLSASVAGQKPTAGGGTLTSIRVTWSGPAPAGRLRDVLTVRTDHPQRPRIEIPVTVEGAIRQASATSSP